MDDLVTAGEALPKLIHNPWVCPRCEVTWSRDPGGGLCPACEDDRDRRRSLTERVDALTPKRFLGFKVEWSPIRTWVEDVVAGSTEGLLILGPVGPGKSGNAFAALRLAAELGYSRSVDAQFLRDWSRLDLDTQRLRVNDLAGAGLVLLDDFGAHLESRWVNSTLDTILDARWRDERPTIITSNLSDRRIDEVFGARIASRLTDYRRVTMDGPDRRGQ